jgi:hypothetical protein
MQSSIVYILDNSKHAFSLIFKYLVPGEIFAIWPSSGWGFLFCHVKNEVRYFSIIKPEQSAAMPLLPKLPLVQVQ